MQLWIPQTIRKTVGQLPEPGQRIRRNKSETPETSHASFDTVAL